ncbi:oligopeptide ABC transporter periplasmic oligopeptide-binding protein [Actinobacillus equuli]|nr:oligopeptide ABC transporter periplasmic oligopeptide-binding protein [Actinobacillus equuli]
MKAVDDYTLVLSLTNPVPYANELTTHSSLLPVNKKVVEQFGDSWAKKANLVGNGAYKLAEHVINEKSCLSVIQIIGMTKKP